MEQALVNKLKNGDLDDIDMDMIAARLHSVDKQIEGALEQIIKSIHTLSDICDNHKEEVVLLGFTFICAFDSKPQKENRRKRGTYEENDAACVYVIGTPDGAETMCSAVKQAYNN